MLTCWIKIVNDNHLKKPGDMSSVDGLYVCVEK